MTFGKVPVIRERPSMRLGIGIIPFLALLILAAATDLPAQRTSATISGNVADASGAVVPGAKVTATATATGALTRAVSDASGFYVLTNLAPGTYRLRVEKSGFQSYLRQGIILQVDRAVTVNVQLQVGSPTQSVTVTAAESQVNTRSGTLSYEITTKMAQDLPLNGRNVLQLMTLAPDMASLPSAGPFIQSASRPEDSTLLAAADGGRGDSSAFYLDGGINEDALTNVPNIYPNPDAIEEFSVETNNYSSKFGGRGGAVINAVTKSGTNHFHGDAFEFLRYYPLNARNFFASTQDGLKRNQYGFTFGGPIQKNKTFFFLAYQGTPLRELPTENISPAPTQAELNGDFSALLPTQLVNPNTGVPFPGNHVPTAMFDPIATKILYFVPVANPATALATYSSREVENDNQYIGRADHSFGNKFHLYASYLYDGLSEPSTAVADNLLAAQPTQYWRSQYAAINGTWTAQPNLLGDFVVSVSRRINSYTGSPGLPTWTTLGANVQNLVNCGPKTSLQLSISGYFSFLQDGCYTIPSTVEDYATNWSWIKGNHTVEFGAEVLHSKVLKKQDFMGDGRYNFGGSLSGNNLLDFLLSKPSEFLQQEDFYYIPVMTVPQAYVSDIWKVTRKLSLSLGVRWQPYIPLVDAAYHQSALFSQAAFNAGIHSKLYPNLPPGLLVQGDPGVPSRVQDTFYGLFDPRVGFAYDLFGNGRTSLRGGYGMFQSYDIATDFNPAYGPFSVSTSISFPVSIENPYQGQIDPFPLPQPTPPDFSPPLPEANVNPYTPGMEAPTIQQWNLTIEQQLPAATLLRVAYEGESAYHLTGSIEANPAIYDPALTRTQNLLITNQRRPMGQYYQALEVDNNIGTSNYNALVVSAEKRMTHGLTFLGGYRWSKCMDEIDNGAREYTSLNFKADYGPCGFNVTNEFHFSYNWALPSIPSLGFVGRNILGGWETNGIFTLSDGQPFSIWSGVDNSLSGIGLDRADLVGDPYLPSGRSTNQMINEWFNTSAFTTNALGTFGDAGRDIIVGPGLHDFDFSLIKSIPIRKGPLGESQNLQFRVEFFNVFNWVSFTLPGNVSSVGNPINTVTSPGFGRITSASNPRIIQFAIKYVF